jgi:hypothetical protein
MSPFKRACENYLGVITAVATDKPVLALTFDDGPHHEYTPALLEILAKYRAGATFFMIGDAGRSYDCKPFMEPFVFSAHDRARALRAVAPVR